MRGKQLAKVVIAESTLKSHPTVLGTPAEFRPLTGQAQARFGGCPRQEEALAGIQSRAGGEAGGAEPTEAAC